MGKYPGLGIIILFWCLPASGVAEAPRTQEAETIKLSLHESVELALNNNLDISMKRYDLEISRTGIDYARGAFDPKLLISTNQRKALFPTASTLDGAPKLGQETFASTLGLSKRFLWGTTTSFSLNAIRNETNSSFATLNPNWDTNVELTITQPIFKGRGTFYNKSPLIIAQNKKAISDEEFKESLINVVFAVQQSYWDLVDAIKQKEVREKSLRFAESLLKTNRAKVRGGTLALPEELQAEVGVAVQQVEMLRIKKTIDDAQDKLRSLIRPLQDKMTEWEFQIIPTDEPSLMRKEFSLEESFDLALANRPNYLKLTKQLENQRIILAQARNEAKPSLNLQGTYRYTGLEEELGDSIDILKDGDYYSWNIGVIFEVPLGNRSAQSQLKRAILAKEQSLLQVRNLEQEILTEVRAGIREVETSLRRIEATRKARELVQKQLTTEEKLFELGSSTSHQVLEMQRELGNSESKERKALIEYSIAVLSFYKTAGTLLEENRITVESVAKLR